MPEPIALQPFVDAYPPDPDVRVPEEAFLAYGVAHFPEALIELWRVHGLGFYGDQQIALVDPGAWTDSLQTWLGADVTSIPFAVTSFGHIYHYDHVDGADRIQCLDPHFQNNVVIPGDLTSFFNEHLPSRASHLADLRALRQGARQAKGALAADEIYFFTPMLALGGQVRQENLDKGNGQVHLDIIHQMVRQHVHQ